MGSSSSRLGVATDATGNVYVTDEDNPPHPGARAGSDVGAARDVRRAASPDIGARLGRSQPPRDDRDRLWRPCFATGTSSGVHLARLLRATGRGALRKPVAAPHRWGGSQPHRGY